MYWRRELPSEIRRIIEPPNKVSKYVTVASKVKLTIARELEQKLKQCNMTKSELIRKLIIKWLEEGECI